MVMKGTKLCEWSLSYYSEKTEVKGEKTVVHILYRGKETV